MKRTYFTSIASTFIFFAINIFINLCMGLAIAMSVKKYGEFRLDMAWMLLLSLIFFIFVINAHFAYIGMFSRVILTEDKISQYRMIKAEKEITWVNVKNVEVVKEMKTYNKSAEVPVILITGYDSSKKNQVVIKVDYRKKVHDNIAEFMKISREKEAERMNKYFEES